MSVALLLTLVVFTPLTAMSQSADLATTGAFLVRDGVVLDAARGVAYLMNPAGGIDAVDLAVGSVRWSSDEAARPLAVVGDLLLAQGNATARGVLPLVTLNAARGSAVGKAQVSLPGDVWARVSHGLGSSFELRAAVDGGDVLIAWTATRSAGGAAGQGYVPAANEGTGPGVDAVRQVPPADRSLAEGAARVNPISGRVAPVSGEILARRGLSAQLGLAQGSFLPGVAGEQYLSADGLHVLASELRDPEGLWDRYRWTIYERASGARLAELTGSTATAPFAVAAGRLVFETRPAGWKTEAGFEDSPLMMRAVDLTTGAEIWQRELRDVQYYGPFPP